MALQLTTAPDIDDDIFARPPRALARQQAKTGHIVCRVCDRPASVPLNHPALLCQECMADLDATRARVATWLSKALERLDANQRVWDAARLASPAADRWEKVQAALIGVAERRIAQAALNATWAARKAEGGALAALLIAYEGYTATCDQLSEELQRLHRAQNEINTAYLEETP